MPRWVGVAGFSQPSSSRSSSTSSRSSSSTTKGGAAGVFCGHSLAQGDHIGKWVFLHGIELKRVDFKSLKESVGRGKGVFQFIQVVDVPIGREWVKPVGFRTFQSEGGYFGVGGKGKQKTMGCFSFVSGEGEPPTKWQDFEKVLPGFNDLLMEEYEGAAALLKEMERGKGMVEAIE